MGSGRRQRPPAITRESTAENGARNGAIGFNRAVACGGKPIRGRLITATTRRRRYLRLDPNAATDRIGIRVRSEQARLFWSASFLMPALGLAIAAALAFAQWPVIERPALFTWLGLVLAVSAVWAITAYLYRRRQPSEASVPGLYLAGGIAFAYGAAWGSAALLLFPEGILTHQAILTVMLAGLSAGAVTMLSSLPLTGIAFLVPALLPLCYRFAFTGTHDALLILAILMVLLLTLILSNRHLYTTLRDNLRLRIEKAASEAALHESEARYRLMFDQSPLGVLHYDAAGKILDCNNAFIEILGSSRAQVIGTSMLDEVSDQRMAKAVQHSLESGWGYYEATYDPIKGVNRAMLRAFFNRVAGPDEETLGGVGIVEDFTQRKQAEEALNRQAYYDAVTGLPNRRLLRDRLDRAIQENHQCGRFGALLFLDLDYFKRINDWLGHGEGDEVLRIVGERLERAMRPNDTVARLSGDEFILLAANLGRDEDMATRATEVLTERIQAVLQEPVFTEDRELRLTASLGASIFPRGEETPEQLLRKADTAMYVAKKELRGEVRFHRQVMDDQEDERLGLENELALALDSGQLELAYQPIVTAEGRADGCECLLRWHHPERGTISPSRFIPVAEASGLIIAIGRWLLDSLAGWYASLGPNQRAALGRLSMNVSAREFHHPEFVRNLEQCLERHGLDGRWLTLEVTENVLIDRIAATVTRMERLREHGIRFEVDDFGTGYSSLTYLKRLPVDGIKIDRSFTQDVLDEPESAAIVDALLAMTRRLNLGVVAEGVESREQLAFLVERDCQRFQGFFWTEPMPASQLLERYLSDPPRASAESS